MSRSGELRTQAQCRDVFSGAPAEMLSAIRMHSHRSHQRPGSAHCTATSRHRPDMFSALSGLGSMRSRLPPAVFASQHPGPALSGIKWKDHLAATHSSIAGLQFGQKSKIEVILSVKRKPVSVCVSQIGTITMFGDVMRLTPDAENRWLLDTKLTSVSLPAAGEEVCTTHFGGHPALPHAPHAPS